MIIRLSDWKISPQRIPQLMLVSLLVLLAGCVQQYPISYYASPGDTIVLGLGGIQRNSHGASNLSATDLAITLTNTSSNNVTTLNLGTAFKAFPDYSSGLNIGAMNGSLPLVAYDGGWFISVTLPTSGLPVGAYTINITSPTNKLVNTKYCYSSSSPQSCEGDLMNIPLQIVNNSNSNVSSSYAQQFSYYPATSSRLDVSPNQTPDSLGYSSVAGMQLVITFPSANYSSTLPVMAVPYSHNPSIQLGQNIVDNSDGTKSLVVLLSAPQGFVIKTNRTPLTPVFSDLSLSLLFFYNGTPSSTQQLADFQIDSNRSHYYDINGNVITQLQPVITYQ